MIDLSQSQPRTVLYLAASDADAQQSATDLEAVSSGPDRTVASLSTTDLERVDSWAADADCVVFAETPTTEAGATLLEIVEACGSTPVVLFTDAVYAPAAARSTDGVDGYVRRNTDDALSHLADEIEWICSATDEPSSTPSSNAIAMPGEQSTADGQPAEALLESLAAAATQREREPLFELLVDDVADALGTDDCWLSTVHFGELTLRAATTGVPEDLDGLSRNSVLDDALETGDPIRIDDRAADDRLELSIDGANRSVCCVPVSDVGFLCVGEKERAAFDDRDCELLVSYSRVIATLLEWTETESQLTSECDRLRRQRNRLQTRRDQLVNDRNALRTERDRLRARQNRDRALFERLPEPMVRYEIEDDRPVVRNVTDRYTDVFGGDRETVIDTPLDESIASVAPDSRRSAVLEAIERAERRQFTAEIETADGVREFRLTVVAIEAETACERRADSVLEGLIVYRDLTARRRTESELADAHERIETIDTLVEEEVRRPLNVARGFLELAEETGDREHFSEVEAAQDRLLELVDGLAQIASRDRSRSVRLDRDRSESPDRDRLEQPNG
ncbi:GAF domain-containing protein [Natrarchaeobius halalkaliphilus]|uniref:GAF domain-containing protein n=1 Tax=Natrarchaeobius halalkaliphilus TaxID=1679091 RepID=A0A3N6LMC9_9EURY|nr:GAF domain-containing protein [Natrarchaeobius halalkaliphilus]RQG90158.1 GAF domain-containing protein [Natrarchaeobius halalkaliphilus]